MLICSLFSVRQFCVCLSESVLRSDVHLLPYRRAAVWLTRVLVCLCSRVCTHVSLFDCLHLPSQLLILTFLAPFHHLLPHSTPRWLPPHLCPSPVGVEIERPRCRPAQSQGTTWASCLEIKTFIVLQYFTIKAVLFLFRGSGLAAEGGM